MTEVNFLQGDGKIDWCADVLAAEASTLQYGLSLAQRIGCNRLVINSYNLEVIETMNNGGGHASAAAVIFDDCYHLACDFPIFRFEHCNREAYKVAHELARLVRFSATYDWFEEPLNGIVNILTDDVSILSND
ncbi:hypothetical protein CFC21_098891 [Triticum aestivum]|uniref:RNase H type-1 domain-containing protein n=2 Tax=Triticum aestivum TaxID=4565 RepID=A0A3B6RIX5_WHEAT|nr:hypothetical protein CFC21_098891 [Triticum aestivum]